jgi:hypothetical protein
MHKMLQPIAIKSKVRPLISLWLQGISDGLDIEKKEVGLLTNSCLCLSKRKLSKYRPSSL